MSLCFSCYIVTNFPYDINGLKKWPFFYPCRIACGTSKYVWTPELLRQTNNTDQKQSLCINCVFHELMELGGYILPYFH